MGITGLLPFLEKATKPCHISEFRGSTAVVDTYCWLHKAATACSFHSADSDIQVYVNYCMKYLKMLQSYSIKPILVFDGRNLPAKSETELKRRESRNKAKQRAAELLKLGKVDEARSYLKQSINITPEIASAVIKACHKMDIDCIVAPYESDAQLAFFNITGHAKVVITEDSDLVLFGCTKVIYKLDLQGCAYLVEADKLHLTTKIRPDMFSFDKFRHMCILSGCDYVESLPGIGLKKAEKFFALTGETNPENFLDKVPRYLNMRHLQITEEYKEKFMMADATFRHQTVFDPFSKRLIPLTKPEASGTNPKYCRNAGDIYSHETAYQVALGNLHPTKHTQLNNWSPTKAGVSSGSIWSGIPRSGVKRTVPWKQLFISKPKEEPSQPDQMEIEHGILQHAQEMKLDCELEVYSRLAIKKPKLDSAEESSRETEAPMSPVLKRNPFIKKLSKFKTTGSIDERAIVKSRYFNSDEKPMETIDEDSSQADDSTSLLESIDIVQRKSSGVENISDNIIETSVEEIADVKLNDSFEAKQDSCTKNFVDLSIDTSPTEDVNVVVTVNKPESSTSQKNPDLSSKQKRKKLGPCRSVGLKRSKSEGQTTLHSFFSQMKKS